MLGGFTQNFQASDDGIDGFAVFFKQIKGHVGNKLLAITGMDGYAGFLEFWVEFT